MGEAFDYAKEFKSLDLNAVIKDLEQIPLKRSRIRHGRRSWRIGRA
jgi:catalase (peroxidase I)